MKTQDSPNTAAVREGLGPYYPTLTMRSHFDPPEVAELLAERDAAVRALGVVVRSAKQDTRGRPTSDYSIDCVAFDVANSALAKAEGRAS